MVCRSAGPAPCRAVARDWKLLARAAALLILVGCAPAQELSTWPIKLRQVSACPVGAPSEIQLLALGDFPTRSYDVRSEGQDELLDDVPLAVREILVSVTTTRGTAEGRRARGSNPNDEQALWVLGRGLSCPLGDEFLSATEATVVVPLPEGGALVAGGNATDTLASSDAYLLVEGSETRAEVEGGMLLRRAYASGTLLRDVVVVAGGTADRRAGAHDTYELFELKSGRFSAARSGKLTAPRMQHAALLLPDERVLLVGGRSEADAPPLSTAELLDPLGGGSERLEASLQLARVAPSAFMLDSGRVLIAAGRDGDGRVLGSIELYSEQEQRFALALTDLPVRGDVSVAALPGARIAWLTCDHVEAGGGAGCELALISERDGELEAVPVALDFPGLVPNGLKEMRLIYAGEGQLLWTGADDSDPTGRRRAFVIEPAAEALTRVAASRVPSQLVRLSNGLIAELDGSGASLRAAFTRGRYASPEGNVVLEGQASLVLDAPGHWLRQEAGLQALVGGARVDVGELRFAAFQGHVSVQGDFTLLVYDGLGQRSQLSVANGELHVAGPPQTPCSLQLQDQAPLTLRRAGDTLSLPGTRCSLRVPAAAVGVALSLEQGAILHDLRLDRN